MSEKTVASRSEVVEAMWPEWQLAAVLMSGTRAMRAAGSMYMPKWPKEDGLQYDARLATSTLFPAYQRTVETLASKPLSKPITLPENMDKRIEEWLNDVDLQGRGIDEFTGSIMESALSHGLTGILVDFPRSGGVTTVQQETALGLRPYMVHIRAEQLLGWRAARVNGQWEFKQLRLMEKIMEDDGEFGEKMVEQVRVLEPGRWTTYRETVVNGKVEWVKHEEGITTLGVIPFVPCYGLRKGFMVARPPMLELAHLNVKHWQSQSDQDTLLHVARVPILAMSGIDDDNFTLTIGSSMAVKLPGTSAQLFYVEHSGSAIGAGKEALTDLKDEMRQAGAELLVLSQGPVTATEVATDNAVGMCHLQKVSRDVEGAINVAVGFMCDFVSAEKPEDLKLFSDFAAATLAEASLSILATMATQGKLSDETLFLEGQRRGIISSDISWEDERERIEGQGPPPGSLMPEPGLEGEEGEPEPVVEGEPGVARVAPAKKAVPAKPPAKRAAKKKEVAT